MCLKRAAFPAPSNVAKASSSTPSNLCSDYKYAQTHVCVCVCLGACVCVCLFSVFFLLYFVFKMLTNQFTRLAYRRYRMTNGFPFRLSSVPLRFRFHFVLSPIRFLLLFCSIANTAGPVGGGGRERERGWGNGRRVYCYTRLHLTLPKFKSLMQSLSASLSLCWYLLLALPAILSLHLAPLQHVKKMTNWPSTVGNWLLG